MKNYLDKHTIIAVSANSKEDGLNQEQTLDTTLLPDEGSFIDLEPRKETNENQRTGKEEADRIFDLGSFSGGELPFSMATAHDFAFAYSYALGDSTPSAWGTGYKNLIVPTTDMSLPSFTLGQRAGNSIFKRLFASMFAATVRSTFERDSWAKLALGAKGTGKYTDNTYKETVQAAFNATQLNLAANGVHGADAAARLDSIHHVRAKDPTGNHWVDVVVTAASDATPAVLTIEAPGVDVTVTDYEILYIPTEPAWCTFPSMVEEPPLRVNDLVLNIGGKWDGAALTGGHTLGAEVESIEHNLDNSQNIEFRIGGTGSYASHSQRHGRKQTLKLNRQLRDFLLKQRLKDNEYFPVYMKATGAEFETGKNYYVEMLFPRCAVLNAPMSVNDKVLGEPGDLAVLEDDTYGSIRVECGNKVNGYAQ